MPNWKTTAVLAVLLVGLGTFFYVYEVRQGPAREKATLEKDRAWKDLESKDIEEVTLTRKGETIRLRKTGEQWALASPVESRADAQPVTELLTTIATLRVEREIEPNPTKLGDFGLETPAAEVQFTAKGATHRIRLGAKNPTGLWVYAQLGDKPAVVLVPDSLLRDAGKPVADFRDKTVLAFERAKVTGLEVKTPAGQTVAARLQGTDQWQVTAPATVPADREAVTGLLDKLRDAKVKEFVGEAPAGPDPYGLERPLALTLWLGEEKDRAAKTLRFGKPIPDKKTVFAQREGDATVFTVEEALLRAVPVSLTALRDKSLFAYDRAKLERLEVESPRGKVALAMEGGSWRITAPAAYKADESAVGDLLLKARDVRAKDFVAEDQGQLARYGLDRPQVRLTVWEKEAKEPKSLLLVAAKDAKAPDLAYAAVSTGGPVVLVDAKALTDLAPTAQELRDRSLFAGFDTREVTRVQIARKEQTIVLERAGEDDWKLTAPRSGGARSSRVNDLLWTLRNLRWRELVAEQGWEPAKYGLDAPGVTLTLSGKDGKTIAALAIGTRERGDAYVRVPGRPALFVVDARTLGEIPATPDDLAP
jgi:hypothetical protein